MFEEVNKKIFQVKEKLREKEKLEGVLEELRRSLKEQEIRKKELYNILDSEEKDVKKLEKLSITGLFYSILGSKEEQIKKERQEFLAAKLKYDECCNGVSILEKEVYSYEGKLREYINLGLDYNFLIKYKERLIIDTNDNIACNLIKLMDKASDLELDLKEIREAITAGDVAKNALANVLESLESASNWGTWDMVGGGFLTTAAKHSRIDEAKEYMYYAQSKLRSFKRELTDVKLNVNIEINIGSFETFADYFFDGLISDWIVQSKINNSLNEVYDVQNSVMNILDMLTKRYTDLGKELVSRKEEIKGFIENAK
ncbi:hypothetical protein [Clostridium thailandense]|uniref:hypothetical protein n=1 Tax=Clostridium thailandense TaxID=2794346 RepID=UPI003989170B